MRNTRLMAAALFMISPFAANAEFIDIGDGMIYDDQLDVTWLQDANYAMTSGFDADGLMTWELANLWAESLTVGGVTGWRLPTMTASNPRPNQNGQDITGPTNENELGWLWYQLGGGADIWASTDTSPFINLPFQDEDFLYTDEWYWSSETSGDIAWRMSMICACWDSQNQMTEWHAWAVHDGYVTRGIPEPGTLSLLGIGLAALGYLRRQKA